MNLSFKWTKHYHYHTYSHATSVHTIMPRPLVQFIFDAASSEEERHGDIIERQEVQLNPLLRAHSETSHGQCKARQHLLLSQVSKSTPHIQCCEKVFVCTACSLNEWNHHFKSALWICLGYLCVNLKCIYWWSQLLKPDKCVKKI